MKFEVDSNGYAQIREGRGRDVGRRIALHRLNAYAWGIIDDPVSDLEVDHVTPFPWLNTEWNLEAVDPVDHGRRTRAREQRRKARTAPLTQYVDLEG